MKSPCPLCGAKFPEPHAAACRYGLATYRRTTDHAVVIREVTQRVAGIVHFIEHGRKRREFGPRYRTLPASSFASWAAGAEVVSQSQGATT